MWIIPYTSAAHDFQTDLRLDKFTITTASATNTTVQLFKPIYENDTSSVIVYSHDVDDSPLASSYNTTTRAMVVVGLAENTTRQLDVTYDTDALIENTSFATLVNYVVPWLWYAIATVMPLAGLYAIWFMRRTA